MLQRILAHPLFPHDNHLVAREIRPFLSPLSPRLYTITIIVDKYVQLFRRLKLSNIWIKIDSGVIVNGFVTQISNEDYTYEKLVKYLQTTPRTKIVVIAFPQQLDAEKLCAEGFSLNGRTFFIYTILGEFSVHARVNSPIDCKVFNTNECKSCPLFIEYYNNFVEELRQYGKNIRSNYCFHATEVLPQHEQNLRELGFDEELSYKLVHKCVAGENYAAFAAWAPPPSGGSAPGPPMLRSE